MQKNGELDADGFTIVGDHRRRIVKAHDSGIGFTRDRASFRREIPQYQGTEEEFTKEHARSYGRHERLKPDGTHPGRGKPHFPTGSKRETRYNAYHATTITKDLARDMYTTARDRATGISENLTPEQREFYEKHTGRLRPDQHARLDPKAGRYWDKTYDNATLRQDFLHDYPHGFHTKAEQEEHWDHADTAYGEFEYARVKQEEHEKHRNVKDDPRRDKYGRPMSLADY